MARRACLSSNTSAGTDGSHREPNNKSSALVCPNPTHWRTRTPVSAEWGNLVAEGQDMVVPDKTIEGVSEYDGALRVRVGDDRISFVDVEDPFRVGGWL